MEDPDRLIAGWEADVTSASAAFDRAVSFLAGGALTLSITFLHDIAPRPVHEGRLAVAWVALWAALMASLFSHLTSDLAHRRLIDKARQGNDVSKVGGFGWGTVVLNGISAVGIVVGTGFLAYFAFGNLLSVEGA